MKKILLLLLGLMSIFYVPAQEQSDLPKSRKFHIGLDYSYMQTGLKLTYMTSQSLWNETDYGVNKMDQNVIDTINSLYRHSRNFSGLAVEFGMILLNKPEGKWLIDGKIILGLASTNYEITDTRTDHVSMKINSGFSMPSVGLGFLFRYSFTPHWGLGLSPLIAWSWGTARHVEDNTYPSIEYFTETRTNKFQYFYSRAGLLASYTIKGFTVSAGPGFYLLYNNNVYRIHRVSPTGSDILQTVIYSRLISESFIDGEVELSWRIIAPLTVSVDGAFGKDLIIHPAVRFNF
jgi:hypothetical protein